VADGQVERIIGSIRRESLDHMMMFDEGQLGRVLKNCASTTRFGRISHHKNVPDFGARTSSAPSQSSQFWLHTSLSK